MTITIDSLARMISGVHRELAAAEKPRDVEPLFWRLLDVRLDLVEQLADGGKIPEKTIGPAILAAWDDVELAADRRLRELNNARRH